MLTTAGSTCSASGAKLGNAIVVSFWAFCVRLRPAKSPFAGGDWAPENAGNRTRAALPAPANVNRTRLKVIGSHLYAKGNCHPFRIPTTGRTTLPAGKSSPGDGASLLAIETRTAVYAC